MKAAEISVPELCSTSLWSNRFTSRWKCWDILHRVNTLAMIIIHRNYH